MDDMTRKGSVVAVSVSPEKGGPKSNVSSANVIKGEGLEDDAHAGTENRHVSILCMDSMQRARANGYSVFSGDFAENLTIDTLVHTDFEVNDLLQIDDVLLRVSQLGKKCHSGCAIFKKIGDCVMPREGIFAVVLRGGTIKEGSHATLCKSLGTAIVVVSDSTAAGIREDTSGPALEEMLPSIPARLIEKTAVPDDVGQVTSVLEKLTERQDIQLILTTGGTGLGPRDVTPESTRMVLQKELPGIPEAMRALGMKKTKRAILSRGTAGSANGSLIVNLPGSRKGATESLEAVSNVLHHACCMIAGAGH